MDGDVSPKVYDFHYPIAVKSNTVGTVLKEKARREMAEEIARPKLRMRRGRFYVWCVDLVADCRIGYNMMSAVRRFEKY